MSLSGSYFENEIMVGLLFFESLLMIAFSVDFQNPAQSKLNATVKHLRGYRTHIISLFKHCLTTFGIAAQYHMFLKHEHHSVAPAIIVCCLVVLGL